VPRRRSADSGAVTRRRGTPAPADGDWHRSRPTPPRPTARAAASGPGGLARVRLAAGMGAGLASLLGLWSTYALLTRYAPNLRGALHSSDASVKRVIGMSATSREGVSWPAACSWAVSAAATADRSSSRASWNSGAARSNGPASSGHLCTTDPTGMVAGDGRDTRQAVRGERDRAASGQRSLDFGRAGRRRCGHLDGAGSVEKPAHGCPRPRDQLSSGPVGRDAIGLDRLTARQ
jgi:hypothetical protein